MFTHFFIARPILSSVISLLIVLAGAVSLAVSPIEQLSADANSAIRSLDATLKSIDRQLNDDSMVQQDLRDSLRELSKAAAEARVFLEYQTRYPEALIKGKAKEE